jgi:hypothetical protein
MDKKFMYWSIVSSSIILTVFSLVLIIIPIQISAYNKWSSNCDKDFGKDSWYVTQTDCHLYCKNTCIQMNCYENYEKVSCSQFKKDYDDWEHYCDTQPFNETHITYCSVQGTISPEEWATLERAKENSERALNNTERALALVKENNMMLEDLNETR